MLYVSLIPALPSHHVSPSPWLPCHVTQEGCTAIMLASAAGHFEVVRALKERGAALNIRNNVRTVI